METTKVLTRAEALKEGYTRCGKKEEGWQGLSMIEDMTDDLFVGTDWVVADKQERHPSIAPEVLKDLIIDHVSNSHCDETGDDTDDVYDLIKDMEFSDTADKINKRLEGHTFWWMTEIQLIA